MDLWEQTNYSTPLSHSALFPLLLLSLTRQKHSPDCSEKINGEYDYIIVGGGAAGSVVAGRLSEESCVSVLLLEAGHKPPLISEVPGLSMYLLGTDVDWKFETVPQKYAATANRNKKLIWSAGKMLGGSGSLNAMNYVRGNRKNYDDWSDQGAKGWSYREVFPYFLKLEDNRNFQFLKNGYHQMGGPITVEKPRLISQLIRATHQAIKNELGYEFVDPNGANQTGFYDYQMNIRDGQRCSSVKGYLVPAEHRRNLDILLNATATKVIITNNRAEGVEFYHNGKLHTVKARKEVIVSGGAVNTPKLLMLSGIGPRKELEKFNIPVIADLPVGENLQDHGASSYFFTINPQFSILKKLSRKSTIEEYINHRSGSLSIYGVAVIAFLESLNATLFPDFPNYQLYLYETSKGSDDSSVLQPEIYKQFFGPIDGNRAILSCTSQQLQPKSRGSVTLRSSDPFDPPVIDPNYLHHPEDVEDIVEGLKTCKLIVNTKAFQRLGAKPFHTIMPGCEDFVSSDEEYFRCFTKRYFATIYHAVGTAKMGDTNDPSTVVDPELRVKGIKGLRVVDASVMPIVPSGNTNIPTIMVAEKAADMIRKSINCVKKKKDKNQNVVVNLQENDT